VIREPAARRFWVGFPTVYDCVMRTAERGRLAEWRRDVVRPADGEVLEIAAGTGLDFTHYRPGVTVIATEPDLRMLDRARVRAQRADATIVLVAADAQALPFRDQTFDTAVVALGLCTVPSPRRALAEMHRVLRPGGIARLLEHVRVERPVVGWLQDLLTPLWRRLAGGCRLNERSVETVQGAGFHIDQLHSHLGGYIVTIEASTPVGATPEE
jgi:ubiquinone/menaquinone biosynthesis C-methylase UbiE